MRCAQDPSNAAAGPLPGETLLTSKALSPNLFTDSHREQMAKSYETSKSERDRISRKRSALISRWAGQCQSGSCFWQHPRLTQLQVACRVWNRAVSHCPTQITVAYTITSKHSAIPVLASPEPRAKGPPAHLMSTSDYSRHGTVCMAFKHTGSCSRKQASKEAKHS